MTEPPVAATRSTSWSRRGTTHLSWQPRLRRSSFSFCFLPASISDLGGLKMLMKTFQKEGALFGDKAYHSRDIIESLSEKNLYLFALRKKNSRVPFNQATENWIKKTIQQIETTFSLIARLMPRCLSARTTRGFETRIFLFILACTLELGKNALA